MLRIGLTGGIGAGKSTVAARLRELGAVVVDADAIARAIVAPGSPALARIAARFGPEVIGHGGQLRRAALAAMVFSDSAALADLNEIMHPEIAALTAEQEAAAELSGAQILVYDMPLLVENGLAANYDAVIVVAAQRDVRMTRLGARGIDPADAAARMAVQATDEQRAAVADFVIDNSGTLDETRRQVDHAWDQLLEIFKSRVRG